MPKPVKQTMLGLSHLRITLSDSFYVGPGRADLMELIAQTGSISEAAKRMGMSYKRAWDLVDEINYAAGFDWAVHPRLTLAVDAIGRILQDAHALESEERTVQFTTQTGGPVQTAQVLDLHSRDADLNLLLGSTGLRWNPGGNFLLTLNALFSLSDDGLQDKDIIPLIGIDYSF